MTARGKFASSIVEDNIVKAAKKTRRRVAAMETSTGLDAGISEIGRSFIAFDTQGIRNSVADVSGIVVSRSVKKFRFGGGTFEIPFTIPANLFSSENRVRVTAHGRYYNATGANRTVSAYCRLAKTGSGGLNVASGRTLTVSSNTTLSRGWRYLAEISRAPSMATALICHEQFLMDGAGGASLHLSGTFIADFSGLDLNNIDILYMVLDMDGSVNSSIVTSWDFMEIAAYEYQLIEGTETWYSRENVRDTFITSASPTANSGNSASIVGGESNAAAAVRRILIDFSDIQYLASIINNIDITAAYIYLMINTNQSSNARTYNVYRMTQAWVEGNGSAGSGATWNTYNGSTNWPGGAGMGAGTDYNTTVLAIANLTASEPVGKTIEFTFNSTGRTILRGMIDGTYPNEGFAIIADTENNDGYFFHSSNANVPSEAKPTLVIEYRWLT